jgi:hypothetical protein
MLRNFNDLIVVAVKSGPEISPERYTAAEPTTHVGRSGPVINIEPYQRAVSNKVDEIHG